MLGQWCCRSCRRFDPVRPVRQGFRAVPRTRRSRPIVGNGERRCSTCRIHRAGVAIARPCGPFTSWPRNSAGCPAPDGSSAPVQRVAAARSAPTLRPSHQSVRPKPPPKGSLESKPDSAVNLCPRALIGARVSPRQQDHHALGMQQDFCAFPLEKGHGGFRPLPQMPRSPPTRTASAYEVSQSTVQRESFNFHVTTGTGRLTMLSQPLC